MSGRLAAGAQGVALTTLAPEGVVRVQSEEWTAVATTDEPIPAGTPVEVVSVEGLRLYVRRRE
jgi:membrane-bound ClpP family serine protease